MYRHKLNNPGQRTAFSHRKEVISQPLPFNFTKPDLIVFKKIFTSSEKCVLKKKAYTYYFGFLQKKSSSNHCNCYNILHHC